MPLVVDFTSRRAEFSGVLPSSLMPKFCAKLLICKSIKNVNVEIRKRFIINYLFEEIVKKGNCSNMSKDMATLFFVMALPREESRLPCRLMMVDGWANKLIVNTIRVQKNISCFKFLIIKND